MNDSIATERTARSRLESIAVERESLITQAVIYTSNLRYKCIELDKLIELYGNNIKDNEQSGIQSARSKSELVKLLKALDTAYDNHTGKIRAGEININLNLKRHFHLTALDFAKQYTQRQISAGKPSKRRNSTAKLSKGTENTSNNNFLLDLAGVKRGYLAAFAAANAAQREHNRFYELLMAARYTENKNKQLTVDFRAELGELQRDRSKLKQLLGIVESKHGGEIERFRQRKQQQYQAALQAAQVQEEIIKQKLQLKTNSSINNKGNHNNSDVDGDNCNETDSLNSSEESIGSPDAASSSLTPYFPALNVALPLTAIYNPYDDQMPIMAKFLAKHSKTASNSSKQSINTVNSSSNSAKLIIPTENQPSSHAKEQIFISQHDPAPNNSSTTTTSTPITITTTAEPPAKASEISDSTAQISPETASPPTKPKKVGFWQQFFGKPKRESASQTTLGPIQLQSSPKSAPISSPGPEIEHHSEELCAGEVAELEKLLGEMQRVNTEQLTAWQALESVLDQREYSKSMQEEELLASPAHKSTVLSSDSSESNVNPLSPYNGENINSFESNLQSANQIAAE
jgi:hypothetical protein